MKTFIEVIVQTFLAFFSILYLTRILGRQQVDQLTFHEYINGITFGSIAATLATDVDQRTWQHFIGLVLFGILTFSVSYFTMKHRTISKVLEGEPILVIQNGKILEKNLKRARYHIDELNVLLRQADCFSPDDVEYGLLEINGKLSIIKRGDKRNVTVGDLNLQPSPETIPTELIIGGQIIYENLKKKNINGRTLLNELKMYGVNRIEEVMYASMDQSGKLYVDKFHDKLNEKIDISEDNKGV
ncbi:DUF421 domain-containing protein [Proteiniborus sp.]|uniref:DUF421 domain-containing protein n=1 Tax=Proteiniborus sp. TaxID=2079015 RepID=UPI0033319FC7